MGQLALLSGLLGQGSEGFHRLREVGHRLQGLYWRPMSAAVAVGGAAWLTRLVRAEEVTVAKECREGSPLVDQMELLKGMLVDQGLLVAPRIEVVGAAEVPVVEVVVGQGLPASLCQMEEDDAGV